MGNRGVGTCDGSRSNVVMHLLVLWPFRLSFSTGMDTAPWGCWKPHGAHGQAPPCHFCCAKPELLTGAWSCSPAASHPAGKLHHPLSCKTHHPRCLHPVFRCSSHVKAAKKGGWKRFPTLLTLTLAAVHDPMPTALPTSIPCAVSGASELETSLLRPSSQRCMAWGPLLPASPPHVFTSFNITSCHSHLMGEGTGKGWGCPARRNSHLHHHVIYLFW